MVFAQRGRAHPEARLSGRADVSQENQQAAADDRPLEVGAEQPRGGADPTSTPSADRERPRLVRGKRRHRSAPLSACGAFRCRPPAHGQAEGLPRPARHDLRMWHLRRSHARRGAERGRLSVRSCKKLRVLEPHHVRSRTGPGSCSECCGAGSDVAGRLPRAVGGSGPRDARQRWRPRRVTAGTAVRRVQAQWQYCQPLPCDRERRRRNGVSCGAIGDP